jgi:hypothetical protein
VVVATSTCQVTCLCTWCQHWWHLLLLLLQHEVEVLLQAAISLGTVMAAAGVAFLVLYYGEGMQALAQQQVDYIICES